MKTIEPIPFSELRERFGEPGTQQGFVKLTLPFELRASWNGVAITSFWGHEYIADAVIDALQEILQIYGKQFIREHSLNEYGGCYSNRDARGADRKSVHAWGLAVDYMPSRGPFGEPPMTPALVVEAFTKRGFIWGGHWDYPDGMHMSAVVE